MTNSVRGSCLCGGVAFEIREKWGPVGQCHCSKCRKVSGTDGNATFLVRADRLTWLRGLDLVKTYLIPNGNGWRSSFCGVCGSPVPHAGSTGERYFVPAGLLDDDPGFRGYAAHIHVASKAPWSVLTDGAPKYREGFDSARVDAGSALPGEPV